MNIVIDTNIIFSSLIKKGSKIRDIINSDEHKFYSCYFIIIEIFKYKEKIIRYSKITESEVLKELYKIFKNINFINEKFISEENIHKAYELCKDIDEKDTIFLAPTFEINGILWTGDKELKNNLKSKGINCFFET